MERVAGHISPRIARSRVARAGSTGVPLVERIQGVPRRPAQRSPDIAAAIRALPLEELQAIVTSAVDRHTDIERHVRLAAASLGGDPSEIRVAVDRALRSRRFLDYRASIEWARSAQPVLDELRSLTDRRPSNDLVLLLQRAAGHVVKAIEHADDSSGAMGSVAREILELHARACDARVADPRKLAAWMVRFSCDEQDFFELDPVRYASALGENGLASYRKAIEARTDGDRVFAVRWARERLAVLEGDTGKIIELLGGELSSPHHFLKVCEAMAELDRDQQRLEWALRGIAETRGWQVAGLYGHACAVYERRGEAADVLRLRRAQHEQTPSVASYLLLQKAAARLDAWGIERDSARRALLETDRGTFIDALLHDGDSDAAWEAARADAAWDPSTDQRLRLAQARERERPEQALDAYALVINDHLSQTGRAAYARAIAVLKLARRAAEAAGETERFQAQLAELRERNRRRPTFVAMLEKAALG